VLGERQGERPGAVVPTDQEAGRENEPPRRRARLARSSGRSRSAAARRGPRRARPRSRRKKDEPSHPAHPGTHDKDLVEKGIFPKSINIPGTDASFSIGGYAKVDLIKDFDSIGNAYDFQTNSIPVAGSAAADLDGRTTIHARETRINLEFRAAKRFRAFVEGDFYGDGNAFRLRHAYGELGRLLGGQTWSTFQDISAPAHDRLRGTRRRDLRAPGAAALDPALSKAVKWAIAVENPRPTSRCPRGRRASRSARCRTT
jgi:hypothetical protein